MQITPTVHQVDDVAGSPTVIAGHGTLTVIDAGLPDGDHIGALNDLVQASGARVYAQREEAEVIEGKRQSRGGQIAKTPVHVDQIVKEGDVLPIHGGIRVIESFGHTIGHVSYFVTAQNLLIAGDCIRNTAGLGNSPPQYTYNADQTIQTVKKLAALKPDAICFGHGPAITSGAAPLLQSLADSL